MPDGIVRHGIIMGFINLFAGAGAVAFGASGETGFDVGADADDEVDAFGVGGLGRCACASLAQPELEADRGASPDALGPSPCAGFAFRGKGEGEVCVYPVAVLFEEFDGGGCGACAG